jgi:hypothetical protein
VFLEHFPSFGDILPSIMSPAFEMLNDANPTTDLINEGAHLGVPKELLRLLVLYLKNIILVELCKFEAIALRM